MKTSVLFSQHCVGTGIACKCMWQSLFWNQYWNYAFRIGSFFWVHEVALQTANWRFTVTDFVRENMGKYVAHSQMYTEISGPQSSNKDLTNIADIFEQTVE